MTEPYQIRNEPDPWLRNGHLQTFVASMWPCNYDIISRYPHEKKYIKTKDGDTLLVFTHLQNSFPEKQADVLLVPGTEGNAASNYMIRLTERFLLHGYNVHRMNLRGCGEEFHLSRKLFHIGLWEDVLQVARESLMSDRLFIVGISLGGNIVLRMLGDLAENTPDFIRGVATLSAPLDFVSIKDWEELINPFYRWYFLRMLLRNAWKLAEIFPEVYNPLLQEMPNTLDEFNRNIFARLHDFASAEQYYRDNSSAFVLDRITVPSLLVHAKDDPVVPFYHYQWAQKSIDKNSHLQLILAECGGHVGFLRQNPVNGQSSFWAEEAIVSFICKIHRGSVQKSTQPRIKQQHLLEQIVGSKTYSTWLDMLYRLFPEGNTGHLAVVIASMLRYAEKSLKEDQGMRYAENLRNILTKDSSGSELQLVNLVRQLLVDANVSPAANEQEVTCSAVKIFLYHSP